MLENHGFYLKKTQNFLSMDQMLEPEADIQLCFISLSCLFWFLFTWAWVRKDCRVVFKPLSAFHFTR